MIAEEQAAAPKEQLTLPENILTAFTEEAVTEIFSKDEIPFGAVLDGIEYITSA